MNAPLLRNIPIDTRPFHAEAILVARQHCHWLREQGWCVKSALRAVGCKLILTNWREVEIVYAKAWLRAKFETPEGTP